MNVAAGPPAENLLPDVTLPPDIIVFPAGQTAVEKYIPSVAVTVPTLTIWSADSSEAANTAVAAGAAAGSTTAAGNGRDPDCDDMEDFQDFLQEMSDEIAGNVADPQGVRWKHLERRGWKNYRLWGEVDPKGRPGFWDYYYSGIFSGKEDERKVQDRHSGTGRGDGRRFNEANGDRLRREPGERSYGWARSLEQKLAEQHGRFFPKNDSNYRGQHQNPLGPEKRSEYYTYVLTKWESCDGWVA